MIAVNQPGLPPQCARIHYDINGRLAMGMHLVDAGSAPRWLCCACWQDEVLKSRDAAETYGDPFINARRRARVAVVKFAKAAATHKRLLWLARELAALVPALNGLLFEATPGLALDKALSADAFTASAQTTPPRDLPPAPPEVASPR